MIGLHALEAIDRIGKRVEDRGNAVFSAAEKLEAIDEAIGELFAEMRMQGQNFDMDRLTVPFSSLTEIQPMVWEFEVPAYVGDVIRIEVQASGNSVPMPIVKAKLDEKDGSLHFFADRRPVWHWSQWSNTGKLQIRGNFISVSDLTIWFMRRWPPLHTASADAGSTATSLIITNATGRIVQQDDFYIGQRLEITADAGGPNNVGVRRRITDSTGLTLTLETALPDTVSTTTTWALITPLPDEHTELLLEMAANILLFRIGDTQTARMRYPRLRALRDVFDRSIRLRDTSDQRRVHNSRTRV